MRHCTKANQNTCWQEIEHHLMQCICNIVLKILCFSSESNRWFPQKPNQAVLICDTKAYHHTLMLAKILKNQLWLIEFFWESGLAVWIKWTDVVGPEEVNCSENIETKQLGLVELWLFIWDSELLIRFLFSKNILLRHMFWLGTKHIGLN